ncbi:outer membrane beta-barrel protein [Granulicella cerasi]|uniref:Outer membrane beta-barrel protein n=1 Tax=Granulicella cerasi TaxID=741063 RepID=A0ABW1Z8U2_9BACT|nr:outer membrane beta-barrel protein [Granulicella cerasi]
MQKLTATLCGAVALALLAAMPQKAAAQRSYDLGMMYTQERSKFVGANTSTNYFYLRGATIDLGYTFWKGIGVVGSGTGLAGTNLLTDIDIQHIEGTGGLRYTYNFGHITPTATNRKLGVFVEGKGGYTLATAGQYPVNGVVQNHASGLTYMGGGGVNLHAYQRFDVRLIDAQYVITKLPNGTTNQQNTLRLSAGINFHFGP